MSVIKKVQSAIRERGLDALMLHDEYSRFYLTGFSSSYGVIVITRSEAFFLTDGRYIEAARNKLRGGFTVAHVNADMGEKSWLEQICRSARLRTVGFDGKTTTFEQYRRMEGWGVFTLSDAGGIVSDLRKSKTAAEAAAIRSAQEISEKAYSEVLGLIEPGVTERILAAELTYRLLRHGAERLSFEPIVVAGKNSSMPHGHPGDYAVQKGDFVLLDFGCVKNGYCSDMTRTVAVGFVTDEMRRVYGTVLEAQAAAISAARPGVTGKSIDEAARGVIERAGYKDCFVHSLGHSLGLEIHESPNASPGDSNVMPDGAVITAEPGIYLEGKFGVRIEDMLWLKGGGCKNLTLTPKELTVI